MSADDADPRLNAIAARARTVTVPRDAVPTLLQEMDGSFATAAFRVRTPGASADRVYSRGSLIGDVILGGSGASLVTTRVGPLAMRAVVVVSTAYGQPTSATVTIALVTGTWNDVGRDVDTATERALRTTAALGVPVHDDGQRRSVDLPPDHPGNPETARHLGLV